jgi:hypothetical protein
VITQLAQQVPIRRTFQAFFRAQNRDTTHFVMTDEFRVQFDSTVTRSDIDALMEMEDPEVEISTAGL